MRSGFTNAGAVTAMLDALGVAWRPVKLHTKGWLPLKIEHAFEFVIGGERVWVFQRSKGQAFVFQSEGVLFRDQGQIQDMARLTAADVRRRQDARLAETHAQEEDARQRQPAAEQEASRRAADRAAAESEAAAILRRMKAEGAENPEGSEGVELPMSQAEFEARDQAVTPNMEPTVGRLLQANAREVIRQQEEKVRSEFGLTLQQERQDGDVIVLTFRG